LTTSNLAEAAPRAEFALSRAMIDLDAYAHNLKVVRERIGAGPAIMAVIKANAYGHGSAPIARKALASGASMLGVATIEEGIALRAAGIEGPVVVLFQPPADALEAVVEHGLTLVVADVPTAEQLGRIAQRAGRLVKVHCQIDSGMGRQGFDIGSAVSEIQFLTRISHIDIEGVCTHFPTADKPDDEFTMNQFKAFRGALRQLEREGIPYEMAHCCNSPAIVNYPRFALDMVRAGLMTYGVWPTADAPAENPLRPVMRWETRVTQVREFEAGANISYGRTFTVPERMKAAILAVGYADGYQHRLSNRAQVLIHGTRCPVRGSVCMDQTVVDITHAPPVKTGDTAVLLGDAGGNRITAEELAAHAGTIPYEILTGVGERAPRIYTGIHHRGTEETEGGGRQ